MKIAALILAGGRGERAGSGPPKQLRRLVGKPVYAWSLEAFDRHPAITQLVMVIPQGEAGAYKAAPSKPFHLVSGGATRTASVQAGLAACQLGPDDLVLVHDAARPGLTPDIIDALIIRMSGTDAAAPALAVSDALKRQITPGQLKTVSRDRLYRVQTPQIFRYGQLQQALEQQTDLVDDLAAIEAMGGTIDLIEGRESLTKITYAEDLDRLAGMLRPVQGTPRIGSGFDVHAFEAGQSVTLCGVCIPHNAALAGHSDADVAWHALTDAILGAAALGDIGDHFPPTETAWKNADSAIFLQEAIRLIEAEGWQVVNCDITLICEAPKIKPHRLQMRQRTSEITGLPVSAISVKATTTEGLGFSGRREGIAAQASALLFPRPAQA